MPRSHVVGIGFACFVLGLAVEAGFAQGRRPAYSPDLFKNQPPKNAATALLDGALELADNGSWERIAVGRAWYLGGDKARGQKILDEVTGSRNVERSDWFRVARVYAEAGEWDKAAAAFDKALPTGSRDDTGMIEAGGLANVHNDRARAEAFFERAFQRSPREFWHWVNAGGSYLGVRPQ
jgi:tetratricopeptide (TPR) repeat protein